MSLILKQETSGSVSTPPAGKSAVFVDTTGQLGVKQANGTSVVTGNITSVNLDGSSSNVLYGNGTFAPAGGNYGDSNVVTLLTSYGSNSISTTGNIQSGNLSTTGYANIGSYIVINGTTSNISGVGQLEAFFLNIGGGGTTTTTLSVNGTANLGAIGNVIITGGANGYVLTTDGAGALSWSAQSGGSANLEAVDTDILPTFDDVYDIGSTSKKWSNVYANVVTGTSAVFTDALIGDVVVSGNAVYALNTYGTKGTLYLNGTNNLGPVANVIITGGSSGQALTTDGSGTLSWSTPSSSPSAITTTTLNNQTYTIANTQVGQMFVSLGSDFIYLPGPADVTPGWYCYIAISGTAQANIQTNGSTIYESGTNAFGGNTHTGYWNGLSDKSIYTLTYIQSGTWIATFK